MPFSDFYIILNSFFLIKTAKKGNYLPADADVASGPGGELTHGARDHRTDAMRR